MWSLGISSLNASPWHSLNKILFVSEISLFERFPENFFLLLILFIKRKTQDKILI